jgi:prepilin-type N-terminal cleavage/methylation domain-containing protein
MKRAFTLVELLVVVAILVVLAALIFPVFARSKARAKLTDCQTRLRQFGLAHTLYRGDHDGKGFVHARNEQTTYRYPYNTYEPMAAYLKPEIVWCPEPPFKETLATNFYHYRVWNDPVPNDPLDTVVRRPFAPEPGQVLVQCANHTTQPDPRPEVQQWLRQGIYLFVREDLSRGLARNTQMESWYLAGKTWARTPAPPGLDPKAPSAFLLRYPGEPWPPQLER